MTGRQICRSKRKLRIRNYPYDAANPIHGLVFVHGREPPTQAARRRHQRSNVRAVDGGETPGVLNPNAEDAHQTPVVPNPGPEVAGIPHNLGPQAVLANEGITNEEVAGTPASDHRATAHHPGREIPEGSELIVEKSHLLAKVCETDLEKSGAQHRANCFSSRFKRVFLIPEVLRAVQFISKYPTEWEDYIDRSRPNSPKMVERFDGNKRLAFCLALWRISGLLSSPMDFLAAADCRFDLSNVNVFGEDARNVKYNISDKVPGCFEKELFELWSRFDCPPIPGVNENRMHNPGATAPSLASLISRSLQQYGFPVNAEINRPATLSYIELLDKICVSMIPMTGQETRDYFALLKEFPFSMHDIIDRYRYNTTAKINNPRFGALVPAAGPMFQCKLVNPSVNNRTNNSSLLNKDFFEELINLVKGSPQSLERIHKSGIYDGVLNQLNEVGRRV